MSLLTTFLLGSLQPEATDAVANGAAQAAEGASNSGGGPSALPQMALLGVMFVVMYFLMIRPQQKRQKEVDAMLKSLSRGDKVRTSGGIRGEIVDMTESDVTLLIADKVKINVLRTHVASKVQKPSAETKGKDA